MHQPDNKIKETELLSECVDIFPWMIHKTGNKAESETKPRLYSIMMIIICLHEHHKARWNKKKKQREGYPGNQSFVYEIKIIIPEV